MNKLIVVQDFFEGRPSSFELNRGHNLWSLLSQVVTENDLFLRKSKFELFKNNFVVRKIQPQIAYRNIKTIYSMVLVLNTARQE